MSGSHVGADLSCISKPTTSSVSSNSVQDRDIVLYKQNRKIVPMDQVNHIMNVTRYPITDPYGDKGYYTGVLIRGKPESHGTMQYNDGRTYTGEWKRGRWHGQGKTIFANGDVYTGEYNYDKREGVGRYEWRDGRVYDGRFETDQRRGSGVYSWPDGSVYTGEFKDGLRHGNGSYTFADGSVYTGSFKNGKHHGIGECVWSDGRCYRGEWVEGQAHGHGIEVRADGSIRHDGEWKHDRPVRKSDKNGNKKCEKTHQNKKKDCSHTTKDTKGKEMSGAKSNANDPEPLYKQRWSNHPTQQNHDTNHSERATAPKDPYLQSQPFHSNGSNHNDSSSLHASDDSRHSDYIRRFTAGGNTKIKGRLEYYHIKSGKVGPASSF